MARIDAAVLYEAGQPLQVEQISIDDPGPGQVMVRLVASGLCHTDWSVMSAQRPHPLPVVLGHEGAGVVEAVGDGVTQVQRGDPVICSWAPNCGCCFYCDHDLPFWCNEWTQSASAGTLFDGKVRLSKDGEAIHHFTTVSSHAQCCVIEQASAVPIHRDMPLDRACLIGCAVMTGYGAVVRHASVEAGESVAVFGCGGVGLNVVQTACMVGAGPIIAVDVNKQKLTWATEFGATHTLNAAEEAVEEIRKLTHGRGVDYSFEAAGHPEPLKQAIEAARPGGRVVLLGAGAHDAQIIMPYNIFRGDKTITRLTYGQGRPRIDFPRIVELYMNGKLKLDELITAQMPLERINDGFEQMVNGNVIRAIVTFG